VLPDNATNKTVRWASDSPEVATVNENGLITGISAGTATVTVTTVDGEKTASCFVTVTVPAPSVPVAWYISGSTHIEGSPAGTSQTMKDALVQIKAAKAGNRFTGNQKAVIVVTGTITPATEGSLSGNSLVNITGAGAYPPIVLRGAPSGGTLDAANQVRVLYVMDNHVTIADNITLTNGNTNIQVYGGGVYLEKSSLQMTGGTISNCTAYYGAGVCIYEDKDSKHSSFLMTGGTIKDCNVPGGSVSGSGAGVFVDMYCSFTLFGGVISHNGTDGNTDNGGGVSVNGNATFTMNGGEISGNKAIQKGGGVNISGYGSFVMNNGTITGNTAPAGGGSGVFVSPFSATFIRNGGSITGNNGIPDLKQ
jgi:hypothetical protein